MEPSLLRLFLIFLIGTFLLLIFLTLEGLGVVSTPNYIITLQVLLTLFVLLLALPNGKTASLH